MSITETFSNSIDLEMINEYDQDAVMQFSTVFEHVYNVACRRILWNGTFQNLSDHVFVVRNFWNKNSMSVIFCFHRQPMWKRSPKIWHVNKRDFLENKFLGSDQRIRQRCCDSDFNIVWARLTYCFSKNPLKLDFLEYIWLRFRSP